MLVQLILAAGGVGGSLSIHFGALFWLLRRDVLQSRLRSAVLLAFVLMSAHLVEIGVYAALYQAATAIGLGELRGAVAHEFDDYFYFSAMTYTTVGFGDVTASPGLHVLTAVEALNGIVLAGVSTSAMFVMLSRVFRERLGLTGPRSP